MTSRQKGGPSIAWFDQKKELPAIKQEHKDFNSVYSHVLSDVLKRVDLAFERFFSSVSKFPRYKSLKRFASFTYPDTGFKLVGGRLELSKIGSIKVKLHRQIPEYSKVKTCTIKRSGDHWYCTLVVEYDLTIPKKVVSTAVGIDLGLEAFATLSDGGRIENPRYYRKSEERLKEVQSRYVKHRGRATGKQLSGLHRKIANQRKDFLHKEARKLVDSYDLIAHEDLNIRGLAQMRLSKSVHDAGWGMFIQMVTYKAEEAGTHVVAVNPYRTSQICSHCGALVKKTLATRQHDCPVCGLSMNRDLNAAHNILRLGTSLSPAMVQSQVG